MPQRCKKCRPSLSWNLIEELLCAGCPASKAPTVGSIGGAGAAERDIEPVGLIDRPAMCPAQEGLQHYCGRVRVDHSGVLLPTGRDGHPFSRNKA